MCLHLKEEMKMKSKIAVSFLSILLLAAFGCSKPESQIIGKWIGKTGVFDFSKDRTGVINPIGVVDLPRNVSFKWSLQGKDIVKIDVGPPIGKTYFGRLQNNKTIIIEDDTFVKQE
jgi:hypothetical protein